MNNRSRRIQPRLRCGRARLGMSILELVIGVGISSILITGLSSAFFIASRSVPNVEIGPLASIRAGQIVDQLAAELETAVFVSQLSTSAIGFTVPDRNGDGINERILYSWSGVPGGALTRQYNGGAVTTLVPNVNLFTLTPASTNVAETYPGLGVEDGAESQLVNNYATSQTGSTNVTTTTWMGQYLKPTFAANVTGWRPTRIQFMAEQSSVPAVTLVQMRPANASNTPTSTVLEQYTLSSAVLVKSVYNWQSYSFTTLDRLAPNTGICLVLQGQSGQTAAIVQDNQIMGGGELKSSINNGVVTWQTQSSKSLQYQLYGKLTRSGATQSFNSSYLTSLTIGLQIAPSVPLLTTTSVMLNHPELLSGLWELKFNQDPTTVDINGDAQLDWVVDGGGSFVSSSLVNGVWTTSGVLLDTSPGSDFNKKTVVDLRCRNTTVGGNGATFAINALRSGSTCVPITSSLALQADGTQTLVISQTLGNGTSQHLVQIAGLPNQLLDLHLLIDPASSGISVTVNSVQYGTFPISPISSGPSSRVVSIGASGSTAQYTYARVRVLNQ